MNSQLGTVLLALLSVLKHGVTSGRRAKHSKCSLLIILLQNKAPVPELPHSFPPAAGGITREHQRG